MSNLRIIEFGQHRVIIRLEGPCERNKWSNAKLISSTITDDPSPHISQKAEFVHAIICQHAIAGVAVISPEYVKGLEEAFVWHVFHQSR